MFKKFAVQIVAGIRVSGRIGSLYRTAPKDNTGFHQGTIHKFSNFEALCDGLRDAMRKGRRHSSTDETALNARTCGKHHENGDDGSMSQAIENF